MEEEVTVAEALSKLYGVPITKQGAEFIIKETPTHVISVHETTFSWRVCRAKRGDTTGYDRQYCFYGTDLITYQKRLSDFLRTIQAAVEWDGSDDTHPEGWDKNAQTGEYAHPERFE